MRIAVVVTVACVAACPTLDRVEQANQLPSASAGDDQVVNAGDVVTLAGVASDAEGDAVAVRWTQLAGAPVALASATEPSTTFFAPDARGRLVFAFSGNDGFGDGAADLVFVDVEFNRAPVAVVDAAFVVTAGDSVRVVGSGVDPDGDAIGAYAWDVVSGPADVDLDGIVVGADGPVPVVTPPAKGNYTLSLVVSDSFGAASEPVTTVVAADNRAPTASAGNDVVVANHEEVVVHGTLTDVDGDAGVDLRWQVLEGPSGGSFQLLDAQSADARFTPHGKGAWRLGFQGSDGDAASDVATVVVIAENTAPTVALPAQASTKNLSPLALAAEGRDDDGDVVGYRWSVVERPAGGTFTLVGTTTAEVLFTPRGKGRWVLGCVPGDGSVDGEQATVEVTAENAPPVASAPASASVVAGSAVNLIGDGVDVDGDVVSGFRWSVISGPPGVPRDGLVGDDQRAARFTPSVKGDWVVGLVVNDGEDDSDVVLVNVAALNNPPRVSANTVVRTPNTQAVVVDAAAVDDDGDAVVAYSWRVKSLPDGGSFTLLNDDEEQATLVPRGKGAWTLELIASDGESESAPTDVLVIAENNAPTTTTAASAEVGNGDALRLLAQSADVDGDDVDVAWAVVAVPAGGRAVLAGAATAEVTFTGFGKGSYRLSVTPSDGDATGDAAFVDVEVDNVAPTANAGPDQSGLTAGTTIALDGRASADIDGDPITFSWTQSAGPAVVLNGALTSTPTFTAPPTRGTLRFALVVDDGEKASVADEVVVVIDNVAPVAVAGFDGFADAGAGLALDGSGSADVDGGGLLFRWTQTAGPPVVFSPSATVARPSVAVPAIAGATLRFSLTVSDGQADSAADDVEFVTVPSDATNVFVDDNGACTADCDGTRAKPHKTINAGATVALARNKPLLVAVGTYPQTLLTTGLDVTGGCDPQRWLCTGAAGDSIIEPTVLGGSGLELRGNVTSPAFHVQNFTVFGPGGDGNLTFGLRCDGCRGVVEDVTVITPSGVTAGQFRTVFVQNTENELRLRRLDVTSGDSVGNEGLVVDSARNVVVEDSVIATRGQILPTTGGRTTFNVAVGVSGATQNVLFQRNRIELNGSAAAGICQGVSLNNGGTAIFINNVIWDRAICGALQDTRNPINVAVLVGGVNSVFLHNTFLGNTDARTVFDGAGSSYVPFFMVNGAGRTIVTNNYIEGFTNLSFHVGFGDMLYTGNTASGFISAVRSQVVGNKGLNAWNDGDGSAGVSNGDQNVAADCLLTSALNGDVHLRAGSPCINSAVPGDPRQPPDDFEGDPRSTTTNIDRGADEVLP